MRTRIHEPAQLVAPRPLHAPAAHGRHDAGVVAYVPAGHEVAVKVQVSEPAVEYEPTAHAAMYKHFLRFIKTGEIDSMHKTIMNRKREHRES